jgi:purine-nucleoside phosphorylase
MASTYSDLKIELIGTGEQVGTWGSTTNTNLGIAFEEAITGSADITFSGVDLTLILTNSNSSQDARNLRLVCKGVSGGARQLILGSGCQIHKLYIVKNELADNLTIKNTTGTGITIPSGGSMFVFNDGVNVVDVVTTLNALTLTNTTLINPTLNDAVLNTPTSGNLLNCTVDGANLLGYRTIPASSEKTSSYILQTSDVSKLIVVGSGGSITVPNAVFSAGDAVLIFNNTASTITLTMSITASYIGGVNTDYNSISLLTRGVANILFISGTICVVTGNVS